MTEKDLEIVKRGRFLVTNQWVDEEERTWKFELIYPNSITVYVDGKKFIDNEQVLSVLNNYTYWLYQGTINLGQIIENNIVDVKYKNNNYVLMKIIK